MYTPPSGYVDMEADAERDGRTGPYHPLEVPKVGVVQARYPLPNAIPALSMAASAKIGDKERLDYLTKFVMNHITDEEFDRISYEMAMCRLPADTFPRIATALAKWGTPRPTVPSSR